MNESDTDRLWDEYKYRHQHSWNTLFKLTLAVVAISVLPLTQETAVCVLGSWILLLPIVAVLLSAFGSIVLYRELRVLSVIRVRHRDVQGTSGDLGGDWFSPLMMTYLVALSIAAGLNLCAVRTWQTAIGDTHSRTECFGPKHSK